MLLDIEFPKDRTMHKLEISCPILGNVSIS
jgi:hypothetical protein